MSIARRNRAPLASPLALLLTGLIVIVTGLAVHFVVSGLTGDLVGGALYAVLVCLVVAFVAPRQHPLRVGAIGFALCVLVELFQLTGVPLALAEVSSAVALVLGTTFVALDFVAYAAGAFAAAVGLALGRSAGTRARLTRSAPTQPGPAQTLL